MKTKALVTKWFRCWTDDNFQNIPVSDDFKHISPFGTIDGKVPYLQVVEDNRDTF